MLLQKWPNAVIGSDERHFILPEYPLPTGVFVQSHIRLLVILSPTYPTTPPDNFYVAWGLALKSGGTINNYSGPTPLYGEQWGTFSFHPEPDGWHAHPNVAKGDNVLTFLTAVRGRLQEGA